ncbi:unnamed protein product [Meloidogyne enterolobii]|uniref:Uncharacterized protein n=1 Tax=Meloidogyne enterolobii TaxID=390850 RepID=A0ACB0YI15_MELEN
MRSKIFLVLLSFFIFSMINAIRPPRCNLAKQVGLCSALLPRWYYDNGECKVNFIKI